MPWNLADAVRRYEAGESLVSIAQALDTPATTVYRRLLAGGLPPRETAPWGARRRGTRNYARERARHDALAPDKQRAIYDLLRAQLPERELALIGRARILAWLHSLGLRRPNGGPVSWTMVLRWTRHHGFPLLHGTRNVHHRTPAVSTSFAITAWVLSRLDSGQNHLFRFYSLPEGGRSEGTRPSSHVSVTLVVFDSSRISGGSQRRDSNWRAGG
jgi:hypothetical protein